MVKRLKSPVVVLGEPQDGQKLLVKNIYPGGISISPVGDTKTGIELKPKEHVLVEASWGKNPDLLKFIRLGFIRCEYVDAAEYIESYPDPQSAPPELQVENAYERQVAMTIAQSDDTVALKWANTVVNQPDSSEPDIPFMRKNLYKIFKLAIWLEERLENRPKIIKALKDSLKRIQDY